MSSPTMEPSTAKPPPIVLIMGGPGSGKGTLCNMLVKKYGYDHLSTGDLLRAEVAAGIERGQRLDAIIKQGLLVPLDDILAVLREAIDKRIHLAKGFLLDGFPRTVDQAIYLESQVGHCSLVLFLDCPEQVMTSRMLSRAKTSGRSDDNSETMKRRLATFNEQKKPLLEHFADRVIKVNVEPSQDQVLLEVAKHFDKMLASLEPNGSE